MRISIFTFLLLSSYSIALAGTCGTDSRVPSEMKPIGRIIGNHSGYKRCTGTLISPSCMITAGHCVNPDSFDLVEFNTINHSEEDRYFIEKLIEKSNYVSRDWAVFKLRKNDLTGKRAGEVQGIYSIDSKSNPLSFIGQTLRISGYGDSEIENLNGTQQTAIGSLKQISRFQSILYDVDTDSGDSGSAIIVEATGMIIGIHTNGGCTMSDDGLNEGTAIASNRKLIRAIEKCIASENL